MELETRFIEANRESLLGNYDKASSILSELLEQNPDNPAFAFALARVYADQQQFDRSADLARQAIDNDPSNVWYRRFLAEIFQKQEANIQAAEVYEELVKLHPNEEEYYNREAYFLVRANRIEDAIKVYDRLEKKIGVSEEVIRRKHSLYLGLGYNDRAASELQRLIDAYPNDTAYRHMLASFYEDTGQPDKATDQYRQILQIDPDDPAAQVALAGNSTAESGEMQYLASLRPIFEKPEIELDLKIKRLIPIVQKVAETNDAELGQAALELTDILKQVHPNSAKVNATAADLLFYSGRNSEAIEEYEATLALDDTVFPVWEQLMNAYFKEEDFEALRLRSEEAMDFFPNKPLSYYYNGLANANLGNKADALSSLEQAGLMSENEPALHLLVMEQLNAVREASNEGKAPAQAPPGEEEQPIDAETLRARAEELAGDGQSPEAFAEAVDLAKEALKGNVDNPAFHSTYAWTLYKVKEFNRAERIMRDALDLGGENDPLMLERMGDILFQMGEEEDAIRHWSLALEKGSTSPMLKKKINDKQLYE